MLFTDPEDQQEKNPTKLGRSCMSSFTYFEHISQHINTSGVETLAKH